MELRIIWNVLFRRRWFVIPVMLVVFLGIMAINLALPFIYESESSVIITSSPSISAVLSLLEMTDTSSASELDAETRAEMLAVGDVLEETISRLSLRDRHDDLLTVEDIQKNKFITSDIWPQPYIEFEQYEETQVIEIAARSGDPEEARMIAETVMDICIEKDAKRRQSVFQDIEEMINDKLEKVSSDYQAALDAIYRFRLENKSLDFDTELRTVAEKIMSLLEDRGNQLSSIANCETRIAERKRLLEKEGIEGLSNAVIQDNTIIQSLRQSISDLEVELSSLLNEKTEKHPDVVSVKSQLVQLRKELEVEVRLHKTSSSELQDLEVELAGSLQNLKSIDTEIEKYKKMAETYASLDKEMTLIEERVSVTQSLYQKAHQLLMRLAIVKTLYGADVRVIAHADMPDWDKPDSPKLILIGLISVLLSLICGLGGALLFDYIDDRVIDQELIVQMGTTALGSIPGDRRKKEVLIIGRKPGDVLLESCRCVKNNIKAMCGANLSGCLTFTSCFDGEGCSTVVANLAISMAGEKRKVLAVDANFHNPGLDKMLKVSAGSAGGLCDVLAGSAVEYKELIVSTGVEGLKLMPFGKKSNASECSLNSEAMNKFLTWAASEFDVVLIDAPPVARSDYAVVLGEMSRATVLIIQYGRVVSRVVKDVVQRLSSRNIRNLGFVMNKSCAVRNIFF